MADESRKASSNLNQAVYDRPADFSLFQLLRTLERGNIKANKNEAVWVRPKLTLGTALTEVTSLTRVDIDDQTLQVETSKSALYGSRSPLPTFYTEDLMAAELVEPSVARVLLDSIHHRLYRLDDDAYRKYNVSFNQVERNDGVYTHLLQSLIGFRNLDSDGDKNELEVLKYHSILGRKQRSAEGLKIILEDQLPGSTIEIEQCVTRNLRLDKTGVLMLGQQANRLGENTILGDLVIEKNGKFIVHIKNNKNSKHWFNQTKKREKIINWIRLYIDTPLECEMVIELSSSEVEPAVLGQKNGWLELGRTTWLIDPNSDASIVARLKVQ